MCFKRRDRPFLFLELGCELEPRREVLFKVESLHGIYTELKFKTEQPIFDRITPSSPRGFLGTDRLVSDLQNFKTQLQKNSFTHSTANPGTMPSKPAQTLYSFFAHVYSFLYYFFYALPFTRKIGPPIIKDRLTCKVEREIESISHRRKMWLFYNVFAEYRWVWAARSLPSRNADSSVDQVDRTVGFRKYLHYHSTKEGQIARKPFGPTHDPERLQIRRFIKFYGIDASEFAIEDPKEYNSYNEFFTRALKEGARAPTGGEERIVSPADSKVVVYPNLVLSRKLWIKNRGFTVANLIGAGVLKDDADQIKFVEGSEDGDWTREAGTKWTEQRAKEVAKRFDGGAIGSFRLNLPVRSFGMDGLIGV